jgi:hypothetical protein
MKRDYLGDFHVSAFIHSQTLIVQDGPMASLFGVSWSHTYRHTVGLLWTSDQPVAETSTYTGQHNIETQQTYIHVPSGSRAHDTSNQAAADLRLRPRGHWDRHFHVSGKIKLKLMSQNVLSCDRAHSTGSRRGAISDSSKHFAATQGSTTADNSPETVNWLRRTLYHGVISFYGKYIDIFPIACKLEFTCKA